MKFHETTRNIRSRRAGRTKKLQVTTREEGWDLESEMSDSEVPDGLSFVSVALGFGSFSSGEGTQGNGRERLDRVAITNPLKVLEEKRVRQRHGVTKRVAS